MRVDPKSEKEIAEAGLMQPGEYDVEVVEALEQVSKTSGNDMIKLKVRAFDSNGSPTLIDDYLVDGPKTAYKVRHAAAAFGLLHQYEAGELNADDFNGRSARAKIGIQSDKNGVYADKNAIKDYVVAKEAAPARKPAMADADDEIPF